MISATTALLLFIGCLVILPNSRSEKCSDRSTIEVIDSTETSDRMENTRESSHCSETALMSDCRAQSSSPSICKGSISTVDVDISVSL